ncbi:MAG: nucleotide exchange factor GrpE [Bacilli bacterium]|nr:nucleotide exchange factor GrpE [Bacilli bacterium]
MAEKPTKEEKKEQKRSEKLESELEALQEENEKLLADVEHWKNEYYRAYADTKNLRNNLEKEHREALRYRSEGFIDELLPVLDSFYMALANEPTDPALKNYLIGFQYIYRNLVAVLENEGVTEITPEVGQKFDSSVMQAVDTVEGEDNIITKVYNKGYKLHDRIVRPANVQVSVTKKEEKVEETEPEQNEEEEKLDA